MFHFCLCSSKNRDMYQVFAFERVAMHPFLLEIQTCTKFCFWKSQEVSLLALNRVVYPILRLTRSVPFLFKKNGTVRQTCYEDFFPVARAKPRTQPVCVSWQGLRLEPLSCCDRCLTNGQG